MCVAKPICFVKSIGSELLARRHSHRRDSRRCLDRTISGAEKSGTGFPPKEKVPDFFRENQQETAYYYIFTIKYSCTVDVESIRNQCIEI